MFKCEKKFPLKNLIRTDTQAYSVNRNLFGIKIHEVQ